MNKKKNGFTLIELLVAVAIMLTVLGIAIVNFINVSDRKKEESWESVKSQIEVAAEEYFKFNEYLFEGLGDGATGTISVGKLVMEDYLNSVTNPITGKKISYCTLVNVTKNNGVFKTEVDENTINDAGNSDVACPTGNSITISDVGSPKLTPEVKCGQKGDKDESGREWCKKSDNGVTVKVSVEEDGNGTIVSTKYFHSENIINVWPVNESGTEGTSFNTKVSSDGSSVCFKSTNSKGKASVSCTAYYLDMDLPTGNIEIKSTDTKFNTKNVNITGKTTDVTSGVATVTSTPKVNFSPTTGEITLTNHPLFTSYNGGQKQITATVKDAAGNSATLKSNLYKVYKDCDNPKYVNTTSDSTDCPKGCGGKKTISTYENYVDTYTGKSCPPELVDTREENCAACKEAECPDVKIVTKQASGAATGWYNTAVKFSVTTKDSSEWHWLTDNSCKEGTTGCVKIDGKTYIDWNVKEKKTVYTDTSITSQGKGRIARVRVFNEDGSAKDCTPTTVNIDTEPPKVDLKKAYNEYYNIDNKLVGKSTTAHESVSAVPNVKGSILLCLDKGEVHTEDSISLTCGGSSDYTVSDNYSSKAEMKSLFYSKALTDTGDYCLFKDEGRCEASKIHPFPSKYYLCYTDLAGNTGCDTLNYILYNSAYAGVASGKFTYGTKGSSSKKLYGWYTYTIDSMWDLKGWETEKYSDFSKK